ncbi:MAG: hypothetical protein ACREPF_08350 [Rhodanobacteraceae bacterium]
MVACHSAYGSQGGNVMLFRQFIDSVSSTCTYLIASAPGREAVMIDPVKTQVPQYLTAIEQLGLRLVMNNLHLPSPTLMNVAIPANVACGSGVGT